jgi:6,7-dimethyl-8-ribityllumazine synthase
MAEAKAHVMIVEARFYEPLADELVRGAVAALDKAGVTYERFAVPGAFEIPGAISFGIASGRFDGYIALGCVVRGETSHYDHICDESARGLGELALRHNAAIGYGILTVENEEQAWVRAKVDDGNKGGDTARACLAMMALKRTLGVAAR